MDKNFKKAISLLLFVIILILCSGHFFGEKYISTNGKGYSVRTVIVDAGHGGFDGGAVATDGTSEKEINLIIAKKLEKLLNFYGFNVIMTRKTDDAINDYGTKIHSKKKSDMENRLNIMKENTDAVFVSIHLNKFTTSSAYGAQMFYSGNSENSGILAESIRESIVNLIEPYNKRTIKRGTSSTYLLYKAVVPAVIVECGFLSNKQDLENLKNDKYRDKLAFAIANGIINYYGSEE